MFHLIVGCIIEGILAWTTGMCSSLLRNEHTHPCLTKTKQKPAAADVICCCQSNCHRDDAQTRSWFGWKLVEIRTYLSL